MTRQMIIRLISDMLKEKFPLSSLKSIRSLLNQGTLMNVFEQAVDKAIESKISDEWQQENQIGV
jgi:hypothetical protein